MLSKLQLQIRRNVLFRISSSSGLSAVFTVYRLITATNWTQ